MTALLLFGDRFAPFTGHEATRTTSQLVAELRSGRYGDEPLTLVEAQGLTAYDWNRVQDELRRRGLLERTEIHRESRGELATESETHKHREPNVLLAGVTRLTPTTYRAQLRLHNDQELLLDHQAAHVQGMVVLEAARQMLLAVCERYYASRWPDNYYSYTLTTLTSRFDTFLYPLPAVIECEMHEARVEDPARLTFDLEVRFEQAGLPAASVRMSCAALLSEVVAQKEERGARRAIRYLLNRRPGAAPAD